MSGGKLTKGPVITQRLEGRGRRSFFLGGGEGDHVVFRLKGREGGIIRILERTGGGWESSTSSPSIALAIRNDSSLSIAIGIMENILLKN